MARLDAEIADRGLADSRAKAKALILNERVLVDDKIITKPSYSIDANCNIKITQGEDYVGRAALKLKRADEQFGLNFTGKTCLDIGASTGGFTQYMLRHGAAKVIAVDVGVGQLHPTLMADARVVNLENTNIRALDISSLGTIDFITVDVSFISLKHIIPVIAPLIKLGAKAVLLIKPQFEVGKAKLGKNGIVKKVNDQRYAIENVIQYLAESKLFIASLTHSPIKGAKGNTEFLTEISCEPPNYVLDINHIINNADCR